MPYVGNSPAANFASVTKDTFSGDGSTTAFTLSKAATTNGVAVYVENVRQIPTTAYTVSGTTLDFGSGNAPVSGTNNIYVLHHNAPASTANHPASQDLTAVKGTFTSTVDINGQELILDADADTSITADTDDRIDFKTGGSDRMHLDGNGKVGIGVNTVALDGGGIHLGDDRYIGFGDGSSDRADFQIGYDATNTRLEFIAGTGSDAQDVIFTTGGRFGIGITNTSARVNIQFAHSTSEQGIRITPDSTTAAMIRFDNSSGTEVGSITSSGSSTAFNTSSDYRLKENVSYDWDATSRLKQLKPARFNWIDDDTNTLVDGFIAHEVSSIVPESITGDKDATQDIGTVKNVNKVVINEGVVEKLTNKENGETWTKTGTENVYQSIDQSKLVPLLVKTIQELEARVTALEDA